MVALAAPIQPLAPQEQNKALDHVEGKSVDLPALALRAHMHGDHAVVPIRVPRVRMIGRGAGHELMNACPPRIGSGWWQEVERSRVVTTLLSARRSRAGVTAACRRQTGIPRTELNGRDGTRRAGEREDWKACEEPGPRPPGVRLASSLPGTSRERGRRPREPAAGRSPM